ncbi:hypothetical protein MPTK2_7g04430 [Marchantia polymorpha subsp. ruderalis]
MAKACSNFPTVYEKYTSADCSQYSSTFFTILGSTVLSMLILTGLVRLISCMRRRQFPRYVIRSSESLSLPSDGITIDDDIQLHTAGAGSGMVKGKSSEDVKCVIMAGEEKPMFLAHPNPITSYNC